MLSSSHGKSWAAEIVLALNVPWMARSRSICTAIIVISEYNLICSKFNPWAIFSLLWTDGGRQTRSAADQSSAFAVLSTRLVIIKWFCWQLPGLRRRVQIGIIIILTSSLIIVGGNNRLWKFKIAISGVCVSPRIRLRANWLQSLFIWLCRKMGETLQLHGRQE